MNKAQAIEFVKSSDFVNCIAPAEYDGERRTFFGVETREIDEKLKEAGAGDLEDYVSDAVHQIMPGIYFSRDYGMHGMYVSGTYEDLDYTSEIQEAVLLLIEKDWED